MFRETPLLDEATARLIVRRAMSIIDYPVNVMDSHGVIIASGDPARLMERHEGALLALAESRVVEIDAATARHLKGVRPGINLPFCFRQRQIGVIGISGEPSQVRASGELVKMAAELMVEQAALLEQNQWEKRYREELTLQLLSGGGDPDARESMAAWLGVALEVPRIAWIIELRDGNPQQMRELLAELEREAREALFAMTGFSEMVMLCPASVENGQWNQHQDRRLAQRLHALWQGRFNVRLIIGGFYAGDAGPSHSLRAARATQSMARRLKLRHKTLVYDENPLAAILCDLGDDWRAEELGAPWRKLAEHDEKGVLRHTLRHYFSRNCEQTQTACALHIHVNTLRYRLQRVEAITGLKINQLSDCLQLYVGMLTQA
ncbi:Sugar diacid utilization regulator SdaR [Cronobacter condimenti 1330]|uniref:Sugar diacid utilization regulator SdaR n=1 Tax=Cronobacter condimenti 1330 TaxID=1073999 RepID=K8AAW0_9ENTR|nr:sugar diacid recognition domain-containing protein [Cronobacter condimenti]ALB61965.1 XRE family transcriptional regulator [Cronobacter condimenti 1330]CCJ72899.1 Sugar diacid utilization regulator SdaR [Cronobacter condimenti 1330]